MKSSILRSELEAALAGRVAAPFSCRDREAVETVSTGIPDVDALVGGLPRGSMTEICGPPCSGNTSLLLSSLAGRTNRQEACALVDGRDAFDPHAADAAGVELKNLLWVRCRNVDQALRAADLLLQGGGFGLVALDLSDIPPQTVRTIPLNAWFRFRKIIEDTSTIFLLLDQEPNAKTCASLVLRLSMQAIRWSGAEKAGGHSVACLLEGFEVHAEVLRSRVKPVVEISTSTGGNFHSSRGAVFAASTMWSYADAPPEQESPS